MNGLLLCGLFSGALMSPTLATTSIDDGTRTPSSFLRVDESDDRNEIALQIAERTYVPEDGTHPRIGLVGVAHIADASYYRAIEAAMAQYDIVLYESVMPAGTGGAGGNTRAERIASTEAAMRFLAGVAHGQKAQSGAFPTDAEALRLWSATVDPRMAQFVASASIDAWQRPIEYRQTNTADGHGFALISHGADGVPGGAGDDADLIITHADDVPSLGDGAEGNLQLELAQAIDLAYQLDAIDYGQPNWRCSDMSMDQVDRALAERGLEFAVVGDMLSGSSLPAKLVSMMLRMIRTFDSLMDGAIADTFKVVLIEMLGDESLVDASLGQLGDGFAEVIIDERNQVVIDDVVAIIADQPEVSSIGILYGAGHMRDLEARLIEQLSYEPADDQWLDAIRVNLDNSAVSRRDIAQIRLMMRRAMKQAMPQH